MIARRAPLVTDDAAEDDARRRSCNRHGGPEVLTARARVAAARRGRGEIVVAVRACALNYSTSSPARGMPGEPTPLPHITGGECRGVIAEVGPASTGRSSASGAAGSHWGCGRCEYCGDGETRAACAATCWARWIRAALAEFVRAPAAQAIAIPSHYPFDLAACLPVAWGTAWRMVVTHAG